MCLCILKSSRSSLSLKRCSMYLDIMIQKRMQMSTKKYVSAFCLPILPSIYLPIYLFIYIYICVLLSIYPTTPPFVDLSILLSIYPSIYLSLALFLPIYSVNHTFLHFFVSRCSLKVFLSYPAWPAWFKALALGSSVSGGVPANPGSRYHSHRLLAVAGLLQDWVPGCWQAWPTWQRRTTLKPGLCCRKPSRASRPLPNAAI